VCFANCKVIYRGDFSPCVIKERMIVFGITSTLVISSKYLWCCILFYIVYSELLPNVGCRCQVGLRLCLRLSLQFSSPALGTMLDTNIRLKLTLIIISCILDRETEASRPSRFPSLCSTSKLFSPLRNCNTSFVNQIPTFILLYYLICIRPLNLKLLVSFC
jgi:hypothetical protein